MSESPDSRPFADTIRPGVERSMVREHMIKWFYGGNAFVAVLILALIMIFLAREGLGFFKLNQANLELYRQAGLEFVEPLRQHEERHNELVRSLFDIRVRSALHLAETEGLDRAQINAALQPVDDFIFDFQDAAEPLMAASMNLSDMASDIKLRALNWAETDGGDNGRIGDFDFTSARAPLIAFLATQPQMNQAIADGVDRLFATYPDLPWPSPAMAKEFAEFQIATDEFVTGLDDVFATMQTWDPHQPVPALKAWSVFLTGSQWLTASFWQDWYGVLPLLTGSLLVSMIALVFAVPLGIGAAVYVNQIATRREQNLIKPAIEFIAAIPSVVLGFFGVIVLGEFIRQTSGAPWLSWWPGFPVAERLNALTAGIMLALVAIPTIFTLAEDALQNVPLAYREASLALGATRMQTVWKVVLPSAMSGIVSAVLLGFGRVVGETMIVLLCAGNRIAIPDFTKGIEVVTQPVHTMTGIIAQEMGEVVEGGIHYRALFMVGLLLFALTLLVNYLAQRTLRRLRLPTI